MNHVTTPTGTTFQTFDDIGNSPVISLNDLDLTLNSDAGPVNILKSISTEIGSGETVGVIGPSGSGKTSMLMVLGGLERATAGAIRVADHDLSKMTEDELAAFRRDNVGVVFQDFHLIPTMTALENVALPMEFAGRGQAFEKAAEALEVVGLGHRMTHYPGQLSGGEQQRTALARAVVMEPKLLLADEPTGNLDQATGAAIMDVLFDLHDRLGSTLILVTHAADLTARCSRVIALRDGAIEDDRSQEAVAVLKAQGQ